MSAPGRASILYVNNGLYNFVDIKTRFCMLFAVTNAAIDLDVFGIFKSYVKDGAIYIDKAVSPTCCDVNTIVSARTSINEVT